jgi:hypothetical protein
MIFGKKLSFFLLFWNHREFLKNDLERSYLKKIKNNLWMKIKVLCWATKQNETFLVENCPVVPKLCILMQVNLERPKSLKV